MHIYIYVLIHLSLSIHIYIYISIHINLLYRSSTGTEYWGSTSSARRAAPWSRAWIGKGQIGSALMGRLQLLFMFLTGTFGVPPLTCFYTSKSARAYIFPQSAKIHYFCSGPISVVTPFVRNQQRASPSGASRAPGRLLRPGARAGARAGRGPGGDAACAGFPIETAEVASRVQQWVLRKVFVGLTPGRERHSPSERRLLANAMLVV